MGFDGLRNREYARVFGESRDPRDSSTCPALLATATSLALPGGGSSLHRCHELGDLTIAFHSAEPHFDKEKASGDVILPLLWMNWSAAANLNGSR